MIKTLVGGQQTKWRFACSGDADRSDQLQTLKQLESVEFPSIFCTNEYMEMLSHNIRINQNWNVSENQ